MCAAVVNVEANFVRVSFKKLRFTLEMINAPGILAWPDHGITVDVWLSGSLLLYPRHTPGSAIVPMVSRHPIRTDSA